MSGYEDSAACKMLATHCCVCGRPLVDAISVSMGIGPDCRAGENAGITPDIQEQCNKLTWQAAVAAQEGKIEDVRGLANQIRLLGLTVLADKVEDRFVNAEKKAKIVIVAEGEFYIVQTPFKRSDSANFMQAWCNIPGRKFDRRRNANFVPINQKARLWNLLCQFFPGEYGRGPKGVFKIPETEEC